MSDTTYKGSHMSYEDKICFYLSLVQEIDDKSKFVYVDSSIR